MGLLNKISKKTDKNAEEKTVENVENKEEKKAVVQKKSKSTSKGKVVSGKILEDVVIHPLVTEKTATLASTGVYTFVIKGNANKVQVKSAIKSLYGITPASVNVQNVRGKRVRFGRLKGKRKDWKKAIVTLPKGKTIDVYEGA